jgi:uncharacterized membrane protein
MGGPTEPTRTARRFRVIVVLGSAVLCISVFLPWCRIYGFTYTFFGVDDWKVLPIAELVVATGASVAAMIRLPQIKRIGLLAGGTALALNMVGAVVAGRFANVHNTDLYFRIWAVISIGPAWGGWIALLACGVLIVGALSRWSVCVAIHGTPPAGTGESPHAEDATGENAHVTLRASHDDDLLDTGRRLPHLNEVLAPPTPPDQ